MDGPAIRVVLADDHAVVRRGVASLLRAEGFEVVAETVDAASTARAVVELRPDVLVLDVGLPDRSGLDVLPLVRERAPETAVLVLTMRSEPELARAALAAGAAGYMLKEADEDELVRALREVARGGRYVMPQLGARLAMPARSAPDALTAREVEVLRLIALGHTNQEIADLLHFGRRTVETHRAAIQRKTGCHTRAELVRYALDHGLLLGGAPSPG